MHTLEPHDAAAERWDALVVGTGMGGATLGHSLARAGWKVLFCEKGRAPRADALKGEYAETFFSPPAHPSAAHGDVLRRAGRWTDVVDDISGGRPRRFIPFIGSGTGGSSALYGMAMERFFPVDFTPGRGHPRIDGANAPDDWPVAYEEMAPFYASAERLYGVRGGADPLRPDAAALRPAPPYTAGGERLARQFEAQGLHPYRLPTACEYVPGCQSCQGYLCPKDCKNDSARACLTPALAEHGAALIDECEVVRLRASRRAVEAVECRHRGVPLALRARFVFLAAGALATPVLLLRSASPEWPGGLANESGLVGRNLMRHLVDLYAVDVGTPADSRVKELAFNDLYWRDGVKLGTVQSFGRFPPLEVVMQALFNDVREGALPWMLPLMRLAGPLMRPELTRLIERRVTLATTLEDLPYATNRVAPSAGNAGGIALEYRPGAYELDRTQRFRELMRAALAPLAFRQIPQAQKNERIAHVCGTCRFGEDPHTSVLGPDCRAHGLENLYVVDSSFFPTSGGTNPSLTIAANALRVAMGLAAAPLDGAAAATAPGEVA